MTAALDAPPATAQPLWLVSRGYDLGFIICSAGLLFVPHLIHLVWPSNIVVDLAIALVIGGPHLFATYTLTFMEPHFRRRYPRYTAGALVLPVAVLVTAIVALDLLVTAFFMFAALHVVHQAGYIADSYRAKRPESGRSGTLIDYGLLACSMFALATFKFTGTPLMLFGRDIGSHRFATGGRELLFPSFLAHDVLAWLLLAGFVAFAAAFLIKSLHEWHRQRLNGPKTLHMGVAAVLFFITPALQNLDVAFQGLNTWHSFQYMAVVIFLNRYRQQRGLIGSPFVARVSARGRRLYGLCLAFTVAAAALYGIVRLVLLLVDAWPGDPMHHHYFAFYVAVLSALLIHYYFDHFLFLQVDDVITPRWDRVAVS